MSRRGSPNGYFSFALSFALAFSFSFAGDVVADERYARRRSCADHTANGAHRVRTLL